MQTYLQIKTKYPEDVVVRNPESILVEYLQYELLDSLFKQKGSEFLSFVGGTAIRLVYGSSRFSEDLDFDNFGLSFTEFGEMLGRVILDMQNKGFLLEFKMVEKGAYHCYVKFPEILKMSGLPNQPDEKILVRIDAVQKKKFFEPRQHVLDGFGVYRHLLVNPVDIVLSQKLITIIQRKREKGRDFYDASFLLGMTNPNYEYLEKQYDINKEDFIKKFKSRLGELDFEELTKDVLPFLLKPEDQERILSFREYIEQKLK
jgi:predicted nucleotidyltransferase component of viral defense system